MSLNVLVTGATGKQGGALSRVLIRNGHCVHAFTRHPDSLAAQQLKQLGAQIVQGNLEDRASIERAAQGMDALFAVSTPFETGTDTETRQGIAAADAARNTGVKHLVYTSVPRADEHTGIPHFDSKEKVEQHVKAIGVPYTILGPAFFMENLISPWWLPELQQGRFAIALPPNRKWHVIAVENIGNFAALVIQNRERFLGKRIDLASDEITPNQVATILSRLSGRDIKSLQIPNDQMRAVNEDLAIMFDYFDQIGMRVDLAGLRRNYPEVNWTTFEQWASKQDWSVLGRTTTGAA